MADAPASLGLRQIEALRIAEGYFGSQILFATNSLGVFDRLASGPLPLDALATEVGARPDLLERLLNAAVCTDLLTFQDGLYANSGLADSVLVSGRPGYMGNWMRLMWHWSRGWVQLADGVRGGEPLQDPQLHLGGDSTYTRDFIMGMHDYAQLRGAEIVRYLDFSGAIRLLDLGGGPGTYSILFAQNWPDLQPTIFDLPEVVKIAGENCEAAGVADRVDLLPGNYYEDELPDGYDVVFLSDVLHQESSEVCELILRKAFGALRPGGRIVVQAMFVNEDRMSPAWPVMHSLILFVMGTEGRAYTVSETLQLMTSAGFRNCSHQRMSLLNVNSLIVAEKPLAETSQPIVSPPLV